MDDSNKNYIYQQFMIIIQNVKDVPNYNVSNINYIKLNHIIYQEKAQISDLNV